MRARILWAATLAVLLFGLAVGPSAGSRCGPRPSVPSSSWSVVASMPQDLVRRGGRLQRRLLRTPPAGTRRQHGHDPGHLLPLQPGQRALGHDPPPMPDCRWQRHPPSTTRPTDRHLRLRRLRIRARAWSATPRRVFDMTTGTWSSAANMPGPRAFHGGRLQQRERQDLPRRRLRHRRPVERAGDDVGVQPGGEHVHDAARRFRTPSAAPPSVSSAATSIVAGGRDALRRGGRPGLGLQHRRRTPGRRRASHAEPDQRCRQRCRRAAGSGASEARALRGLDRDDRRPTTRWPAAGRAARA